MSAVADPASHFEKKVRPLLAEKCWSCHGSTEQKNGLRLDSRAAVLKGGKSGVAIVPGKPEASLLLSAVRHSDKLQMPPKEKLANAEIAALAEWIRDGAAWPDPIPERKFTADEKNYWAFQPVKALKPPSVKDEKWARTSIDRFILARLEEANFSPAASAQPHDLLRRVTLDLTGLPPTPEEVDAFSKDYAIKPEATYDALIEKLLASSAYGEKWGRRWLDVARYADSNGMDENLAHANAWRYRDYVIQAFNKDKPFNQFVREQIAGDLLPDGADAERAERLTATGFLVIGPKMLAEDDPVKMRMDIIDEQLDTIGQAFLGMTLGCARCHDHKFDPITQADYYGLAGIFYSTKSMQNYSVVARWHERRIPSPTTDVLFADYERDLATAQNAIDRADAGFASAVVGPAIISSFRAKIRAIEKARPPATETMAVEDGKIEDLRVHLRGNHLTLGVNAPRRFPTILAGDKQTPMANDRSGRLEFANWLASRDNPLIARVIVNRIWLGHFGQGLVRSPDNFGRLGERPTHPELLDYLAAEFVRSGWSMKQLHRLILHSATYQQSSSNPQSAIRKPQSKDPDNRLLWHFNRRRLDAEELRDGMLAVSGLLDRKMGGTLLTVANRAYVTSTASRNYDGYNTPRRSVYLPVVRSAVNEVLQTYDFPDPSTPSGLRSTTTVPSQALMMLNSALVDQTAEAFAQSLLSIMTSDSARVVEAYRRTYGRIPDDREVERMLAYLAKAGADGKQLEAWRGLCRVLFASTEFAFVE
jgi:cytochrome c553